MSKVKAVVGQDKKLAGWRIWSPGDKRNIMFDHRWTFNGNFDNPTFSPSMLVNEDVQGQRSHFFVTQGKIQYLQDCDHALAGQTVDMVDLEEAGKND